MGGHTYADPDGALHDAVVDREFDLVLSFYSRHGHGPAAGVPSRYAHIPDGILTDLDLDTVRDFAQLGVTAIRSGQTVLARCQAGLNRSGLLTAFILLDLGHTADDAIALIRERRSPYALCNPTFVDHIHAEAAQRRRGGVRT
jgi:protein-tyrosine phosphatase